MSLIPCDEDCIYQAEGYCNLDTPSAVTNHRGGCVHYIKASHLPTERRSVFKPGNGQNPQLGKQKPL